MWRLASDFAEGEEGAAHSSPDEGQRRVSALAAAMHHRYAPRGHFRPWAHLSCPEPTYGTRLVYPTLLSANPRRAFLHDVRTCELVQTIDVDPGAQEIDLCYIDVNERYAFVCGSRALHVLARDGGAEVLRIPSNVFIPKAAAVVSDSVPGVPGKPFAEVLSLRPGRDDFRPDFSAGALRPSPLRPRSYNPYVFCTEIRQLMA